MQGGVVARFYRKLKVVGWGDFGVYAICRLLAILKNSF